MLAVLFHGLFRFNIALQYGILQILLIYCKQESQKRIVLLTDAARKMSIIFSGLTVDTLIHEAACSVFRQRYLRIESIKSAFVFGLRCPYLTVVRKAENTRTSTNL